MATTTNNGWTTPDDTSLVKDGASAIRTLGSAIDTTIGNYNRAWTSWTPTITAGSGTITSTTINYAKYIQIGKLVFLKFNITITNNGTGASDVKMSLPVTAISGDLSVGAGRNISNGNMLQVRTTTTTELSINKYDNTYPVATGQGLVGSVVYEAA
jgi:hypothetical protein